jgi:hypothetical protein
MQGRLRTINPIELSGNLLAVLLSQRLSLKQASIIMRLSIRDDMHTVTHLRLGVDRNLLVRGDEA